MPRTNTLLCLLYSMLFFAFLYLTILTTAYSYPDIKALEDITYCEMGFYQLNLTVSESEFLLYKLFIYLTFASLVILPWRIRQLQNMLVREINKLLAETIHATHIIKQRLSKLSSKDWLLIFIILGLTSIFKLYFLLNYPLHTDETATYDYFVMEGIEAVTGYYPIPNNHVFQNLLNWISYQINPDFFFSVRGTSYLIGTLGLFTLFVLLYTFTNFRTAIAFLLITGTASMPFYFSITGRGYILLIILTGIGFFSTYSILNLNSSLKRLCYFTLTISSILGLYTVPTYLYTFATYIIILLTISLLQKRYNLLLASAGISFIVGLITFFLYSPILVITGPEALFGNSYIAPQGTIAVLADLKSYFINLENYIVGQERLGYIASLLLIFLAAGLIFSNSLPQSKRTLCIMALTSMLVPYLFFLLQGVLPPHRTVVYKSFYFFVLAAIAADTTANHFIKYKRTATILVGMLLVLYAGYQLNISYRTMQQLAPQEASMLNNWEKVLREKPSSMYISVPTYQLFFLHYAKISNKEISFSSNFEEGKAYDILIVSDDEVLPQPISQKYRSIYKDKNIIIYSRKRITSSNP